ncbi:E3 ubiquitin-protein ligase RNF6 isoform X2 [Lepisosteus oculatus]
MDPPSPAAPGGRDERRRQEERLRREEAYYQFIDGLSEDEYRLMRDSNLLGTPGEVTAEELRRRLDGAKERLSAQPPAGAGPPAEEDASSGSPDAPGESSGSDSLLEWLNTFRRTGNATRSGQSGNQTWRAVSRTNPNSGEFRFSLEININHEQPEGAEAGEPADLRLDPGGPPASRPAGRAHLHRRAPGPSAARRTEPPQEPPAGRGRGLRRGEPPEPPAQPWRARTSGGRRGRTPRASEEQAADARAGLDCPRVHPEPEPRGGEAPAAQPRRSRTRARGRARADSAQRGGARSAAGRRSRSPLRSEPSDSVPAAGRQGEGVGGTTAGGLVALGGTAMAVDEPVREQGGEPPAPLAAPEAGAEDAESHSSASGGVRRHPTIMLDLQVRRIRPGENRDRDSIASRTRSRVRMAENTVTFESDSGGFRRTISRSERAGIRTYVSTIRIPLRRISETGLGEPSSTALRSILRQIMTGFGELSSLMETEADSEAAGAGLEGSPAVQAFRLHGDEAAAAAAAQGPAEPPSQEGAGARGLEERLTGGAHSQLLAQPGEGRPAGRDTNNLVENGTLPILRLAHFFLLNDDDDEEHPRGLTKEQIDNLSTRTYGQASLEGELGRACSVCINEYAQGNKLRRLPCAHEFHIHCIDRWLSENNTCPICRQPVLHPHHV